MRTKAGIVGARMDRKGIVHGSSQLRYVTTSSAAARGLAENYTGVVAAGE